MLKNIRDYFKENPRAAIALSGGVDSSFLLYTAKSAGADVRAYYVRTAFQPQFEYEDACRLAKELEADLRVIELDITGCHDVMYNPPDRCYYCKVRIFSAICAAARDDGYDLVLDGTNASDDVSDRPGMKALAELKVESPLRACGYTKQLIRELSNSAGLFTWNKPSYACLATRVKTGEEITPEKLLAVEASEDFLLKKGFRDLRVRVDAGTAKIQVPEEQMINVLKQKNEILEKLKEYFHTVVLDLEHR